jgi:hypothetical protein
MPIRNVGDKPTHTAQQARAASISSPIIRKQMQHTETAFTKTSKFREYIC